MYKSAQLLALFAIPLLFFGCRAPTTPVVTLPQKLGFSQALTTIRDASRNRLGNRPQREWKPPTKRLADPANLADKVAGTELDMPKPIQVAAKVKLSEDLADQKIKGLRYLGMIGCGCYDKEGDIQDAFLEALEDCTPCVRLAAIDALKITTDECHRRSLGFVQRCKEKRKGRFDRRFDRQRENCTRGLNCSSCKGKGCRKCSCNCSECTAEAFVSDCACGGYGCDACGGMQYDQQYGYETCGFCGGAGCADCMSYETVGNNCSCGGQGCSLCSRLKNRRHRMQGFGACTSCDGEGCMACGGCGSCLGKEICKRLEMMAYEQDKNGCWIEPLPNIRAAAADLLTRCQLFPEDPMPEPKPDPDPIPETKEEDGPKPETKEEESAQQESETAGSSSYGAGTVSYSLGDRNSAPAIISNSNSRPSPAQRSSLITAVASPYQHGEIILDLEDSYLLPVNSTVLIQESTGEELTYHVIASEVGRLLVRPTTQPANPIVERKVVHIGVLAQ